MSPIELGHVVTGLRLVKTLQQGLLFFRRLLRLSRRLLLSREAYTHHQHNSDENYLSEI